MGDQIDESIHDPLINIVRLLLQLFDVSNRLKTPSISEDILNEQLGVIKTSCKTVPASDLPARLNGVFDNLIQMASKNVLSHKKDDHDFFDKQNEYIKVIFETNLNQLMEVSKKLIKARKTKEKEHLLADIYTTIRHQIISELLHHRRWPYKEFMTSNVYKIMKAMTNGTYGDPEIQEMVYRGRLSENQLRNLYPVYQRVANYFRLDTVDMINCLLNKQDRNENTHFSNQITSYADSHRSPYGSPSFTDFVKWIGLHPYFSQEELKNIQKIYPQYVEILKIKYWKRLEPGEHIWLKKSTEDVWNVAVYVCSENNQHRVWSYTTPEQRGLVADDRIKKLNDGWWSNIS